MSDAEARQALVFAIAHEIGNHLAGIRLEAHLLDEDLGAAGLARASLTIDSLAGEAGPLLALLRPLLTPGSRRAAGPGCAALLDGVARQLGAEGAPADGRSSGWSRAMPRRSGPPSRGSIRCFSRSWARPAVCPRARTRSRFVSRSDRARSRSSASFRAMSSRERIRRASVGVRTGGAPMCFAVALARVRVADAGGRLVIESGAERSRAVLRLPRD